MDEEGSHRAKTNRQRENFESTRRKVKIFVGSHRSRKLG